MAVMVVAQIEGQTRQGYDAMLERLGGALKQADGFIAHAAHPVDGGWRVVELWQSKPQADRFYARSVAPNLPPGIRPKRSVQELHSLLASETGVPRPHDALG
jgi:hypothetical protein